MFYKIRCKVTAFFAYMQILELFIQFFEFIISLAGEGEKTN